MPYYCGQCGTILGAVSLQSGRCAICGAEVDPTVQSLDRQVLPLTENPARETVRSSSPPPETMSALTGILDGTFGADQGTDPGDRYVWLPRKSDRRESPALFWTLGLLSAAALLIAVIGLYFLVQNGTLSTIISPVTSSSPSVSSGLPANRPTATSQSTHSTSSGATPTLVSGSLPTPTPVTAGSPTASPTSAPSPPRLSVSPLNITIHICTPAGTSRMITISNVGGKKLNWRATVPVGGYVIVPSFGSINPGGDKTVSVRGISKNGVVTVMSSNGTTLPQQVTIKCTIIT